MDRALQAIRVTKVFPGDVRALRGMDLDVRHGETVALIGESGCGKTTLLRMFNRLLEPSDGEIRIGVDPATAIEPIALRRQTGYVPQDGGLLPHWDVLRNVSLVPVLLGWPRDETRARAEQLLDMVGLPPDRYRRRYPCELSGGQRQRVAFARALAGDPGVVLLDEPFGALDALTRLELQREFLRLKTRLSKTMVLVTHDLNEAFRLADRIAVMRDGRALQIGSRDELVRRPADRYVAELVALAGAAGR
ncbi:MAG TPA: ATP-binding cassette domain-containing protein [Candidatus Polarisedimenticolaceae bacterium]|nr:ATP-binding cassette domain-containing protein [Candidatus Polarisedimenticolaceae bacterium]